MRHLCSLYPKRNLLTLTLFSVGVLIVTPFIGMHTISLTDLWSTSGSMEAKIFWTLRLPRTFMGFAVGSALALSGLTFQAMFSNPLATPFTLGVAGGAALGAALYIRLGIFFSVLTLSGQTVSAFVGAIGTMILVYGLARLRRDFSVTAILLAGVAISFFCSSLILFVQYMCGFTQLFQMTRWLMGELAITGYGPVVELGILVVVGVLVIWSLRRELNLLALGEALAVTRGVPLAWIKTLLFVATSFMTGAAVAYCGPIGFVGMMVPHICRLWVGADHTFLIPASFLFGGTFLVICDTLARVLIAPAEVPVGVITALLGGPFFIWLLMGRSLESSGFYKS